MKKKHGMGFVTAAMIAIFVIIIANAWTIKTIENSASGKAIEESSQAQIISAQRISSILGSEIKNLENILETISNFNDVKSGDASACNKKLYEVSKIYESKISGLSELDKSGVIFCAADRTLIGLDLSGRESVKKILSDAQHKPVAARPRISLEGDKWSIAVHVPAYDLSGNFSGTVRGEILLDELTSEYLGNITSVRNSRAIIIDESGDIIYYHQSPDAVGRSWLSEGIQATIGKNSRVNEIVNETLSGKSGTIETSLFGEDSIISYAPSEVLPERNWAVLLAASKKNIAEESYGGATAFVPLYTVSTISILFVAGIVLFVLNIIAKYIVGDLRKRIISGR